MNILNIPAKYDFSIVTVSMLPFSSKPDRATSMDDQVL